MKWMITTIVALAGGLWFASTVGADLIYFEDDGGAGNPRGLYDFDIGTGNSALRVAVVPVARFFTLAERPSDGTVYAVDPIFGDVFTIDVDTGVFSHVCVTVNDTIADITFDPDTSTMYGLGRNSSNLYEIDEFDCSSTLVGNASPVRSGLVFTPDGTLYGFDVFNGDLYTVNPGNASTTFVGSSGTPVSLIEDAASDDAGQLYITEFSGPILHVDPSDGTRTLLGNTGMGNGLLGLLGGPPQTCPWDLDGNGAVATADLLMLLSAWGSSGPGDFDNDGSVATADLLKLLSNWGGCPESVSGPGGQVATPGARERHDGEVAGDGITRGS